MFCIIFSINSHALTGAEKEFIIYCVDNPDDESCSDKHGFKEFKSANIHYTSYLPSLSLDFKYDTSETEDNITEKYSFLLLLSWEV